MAKKGRPSKFNNAMAEQARALAEEGKTNPEIAKALGISPRTLHNWQHSQPGFVQAVKAGKAIADEEVVESLYRRACGYSHPDIDIRVVDGRIVKTEITRHYPPDATSCIFWLKNRQPERWKDRMEFTGRDGKDLVPDVDPMEVARRICLVLAQASAAQKKPALIAAEPA